MGRIIISLLLSLLFYSDVYGAISSSVVWEYQPASGNSEYGGGFKAGATGTDKSLLAGSAVNRTDIVVGGAGNNELTSAGTPFDATDVGNVIQLHTTTGTSGNITLGWYEIVSESSGTVTLDRACASGADTAGEGTVGGPIDVLTDAFLDDTNVVVPGQTFYIAYDGGNDMTIAAITLTNDGTAALPIKIIGYNTTRDDNPTGANRPTIVCAANTFNLDDYWTIENLIFTGTASIMVRIDNGGLFLNCKGTNSSGSVGRSVFYSAGTGTAYIGLEGISTNGDAITAAQIGQLVFKCYLHDSRVGIDPTNGVMIIDNVIETCTTGLELAGYGNHTLGNTIHNCTSAITGVTSNSAYYANNILDANSFGASWSSEIKSVRFDYNVWDNTVDVSNATKGPNAIDGDPSMVNPANGDFTVSSGSNVLDAALGIETYSGVTGSYKLNIGVDQDDNAVGGGASGSVAVSTNF